MQAPGGFFLWVQEHRYREAKLTKTQHIVLQFSKAIPSTVWGKPTEQVIRICLLTGSKMCFNTGFEQTDMDVKAI